MADKEISLGAIALLRNDGIPSLALADLATQVVGMCGFVHAQGATQESVLEVFDELAAKGREALIDIMKEDARVDKAKN